MLPDWCVAGDLKDPCDEAREPLFFICREILGEEGFELRPDGRAAVSLGAASTRRTEMFPACRGPMVESCED